MQMQTRAQSTVSRGGLAAMLILILLATGRTTTVHAQDPVCGPHEVIVNQGGTLVCAELDPYDEPDCPPGWYFDRPEDTCKVIVQIDCGPNPYRYNEIGGHWERRFNRWCYETNHDPFERLFHDLTYGEVLAEAAHPGSPPLDQLRNAEESVNEDVPVSVAPPSKTETGKQLQVDCGQNPYNWNAISGRYERPFSASCLPFTGDPNEALLDGQYLN